VRTENEEPRVEPAVEAADLLQSGASGYVIAGMRGTVALTDMCEASLVCPRAPTPIWKGTTLMNRRSVTSRLLLSACVLGVAASIAGLATYATFTSSTSASQSVSSGTVTIGLGATGASTNRLNVAATNIAAGDTVQRSVDLTNSGSLNLASITLTSAATTSSLLDTDTSNGLQLVVDKCSVPWTETGTAPAYTYTCSGTTSVVLTSHAVVGSNLALSSLSSLTAGGTDHLRFALTLPSAAPNSLQNQASVIQYTFNGTQRASTNQ
jgi:spore coat-associated protein N